MVYESFENVPHLIAKGYYFVVSDVNICYTAFI